VIWVNLVARDIGLVRSTAHRMPSTLGCHVFMEQDEHSRVCRPGPVLVDMGLAVVPRTGSIPSRSRYQRNCATGVARPAY
jgi:DNA-binding IclR family transcriptional regulator